MAGLSFDLTGKIALITGAGRGIGLSIAKTFAAHGAAVAIHDIDLPVTQQEVESINASGGKAIAIGGDATDISIAPGLVDQTVAAFGGLHILVNNAGIQKNGSWLELTPEQILREWTANMLLPLRLSQFVNDRFRQQKWGRIVNLSSIQARRGNPNMLAYSMSKSAIQNLTGGLARDLAPYGVTVNALAPGWMDTLRNAGNFANEEDKIRIGRERIPVGRLGTPDDVAGIALLLCSDAGSYITGETIYIAGGL